MNVEMLSQESIETSSIWTPKSCGKTTILASEQAPNSRVMSRESPAIGSRMVRGALLCDHETADKFDLKFAMEIVPVNRKGELTEEVVCSG